MASMASGEVNKPNLQWRIYVGSKNTLRNFLNVIEFRHPLKKMRAKK